MRRRKQLSLAFRISPAMPPCEPVPFPKLKLHIEPQYSQPEYKKAQLQNRPPSVRYRVS